MEITLQHMLEDLCQKVFEIQKKNFLYKMDEDGQLRAEKAGYRLVDRDLGSKLRTFCKNSLLSQNFPAISEKCLRDINLRLVT